ncbi:MAG: YeeE/YedE family protein, partial [Alphaproteobacteria bacterium]|nr:YeeE/YedE family protein [Alphaproteobacteria bacterium]
MQNFTPFSALLGGALIGLAAGILMLGLGRVAGVSGVLGNALHGLFGPQAWRLAFLLGLVAGPLLAHRAGLAAPAAPDAA